MATPAASPREIQVFISLKKGTITVSPDPFIVHKHEDQDIRWICTSDEDPKEGKFAVEFDNEGPFYQSQFSQDYPCSGLVRRNLVPDKTRIYKYTVRVGAHKLDPGGGVDK
jgi:hypothetical protein